jgi:predicted aldo/keto reductase-like oxidoreductase
MHYRPLGKTGIDVSMLALGCMGFVDDESAHATVAAALDCGINYFETCWGYTDSERRLGEGLGDRRGEIMVSTKSYGESADGLSVADTMRKRLEEQLRRLNTDTIDFYHAWHTTTEEDYANATKSDGWLAAALKAKDEGLIRHVGITTHAVPELVERMIDDGCWETITVQYSLLVSAYREVVAKAHGEGIGIIAIGTMADDLSIGYQREVDSRLAEALDRPELADLKRLWCDGCGRCIAVCNQLVEPWSVLRGYNGVMLGARPRLTEGYIELCNQILARCPTCKRCEGLCPRGIDIPQHLANIREMMESMSDQEGDAS